MSLQENKEVVQRVVDMINEGQLAQVEDLYTSNFVNHDPGAPDARDRATLMQLFAARKTAFPDQWVTIEDMIAEGDQVAKRWTCTGTHNGEGLGFPATGKEFAITAITIYRFSGGKVAECWWNYDSLTMLQQLGVIPPMG
jgi:steroid delta-isomerase-like uncharacterized protein